jgi:hypothetical protein
VEGMETNMREMRGRGDGMKESKEINVERGSGMRNFLQMKGICKKARKEGEKLRNEINQSPLNFNGVLK